MYLYLLKFKKGNIMKIGISDSIESRLNVFRNVYKDYGIDFKNSLLVESCDETIKILERQLLSDYKRYKITDDKLSGRDGYTELRDSQIFNSVLDDIKYKQKKFTKKNIEIKKIDKNIIFENSSNNYNSNSSYDSRLKQNKIDIQESIDKSNYFISFLKRNIKNIIDYNINKNELIINFSRVDLSRDKFHKLFFSFPINEENNSDVTGGVSSGISIKSHDLKDNVTIYVNLMIHDIVYKYDIREKIEFNERIISILKNL